MAGGMEFDHIIVGGGSAGCVVAHRLVHAGRSVLLLEAGPGDAHAFVRTPATFVRVIGTHRSFVYESEPEAGAAGRKLFIPQGRMLGGGSSLNAMVYVRGQPQDYDDWAAQGCIGWAWSDVLPVFRRAEANERLSGPLHGTDGPLTVSDARHRHPLSLAFVRAAQEAGHPYNHDFNGAAQAGVGFYQTTTIDGRRGSTAQTYLRAVRGHRNLEVVTGATATRVDIADRRARGVTFQRADGTAQRASARASVILTAGALATPKLLMLSGVGPADHLSEIGIAAIVDSPGVGANFQDHLEVGVYGRTRAAMSMLGHDRGWRALRHGAEYALFRSGLLASTVVESGGFFDTTGAGRPDVQFHVLPVLVGDVERAPFEGHGISLNPCYLRPKARGRVTLRSADPSTPIHLTTNALSERDDVDTLIRGVRLARRILRQPSLARLIERELAPGESKEIDDDALEAHVRNHAKTVYHPAGTCRMSGDAHAPLDPQLAVRGVEGLFVGDASAMPTLISGNTNAPVIMIAERCADFVLAHSPAASAIDRT